MLSSVWKKIGFWQRLLTPTPQSGLVGTSKNLPHGKNLYLPTSDRTEVSVFGFYIICWNERKFNDGQICIGRLMHFIAAK